MILEGLRNFLITARRRCFMTYNLLHEGNFRELSRRIPEKIPVLNRMIMRSKWRYLYRRYGQFISDHRAQRQSDLCGSESSIVWWFWYQGVNEAPDVCRMCLASLRRWYPEKQIITLDKNNIAQYVTLPEYIDRKHEQGIISHTHYSDILRLELLNKYGGSWIDSTIFFTGRKFEEVMSLPFFLFRWNPDNTALSTWFMVSNSQSHIPELTRELLFEYWKSHDSLMDYFLLHMMLQMSAAAYREEWERVPYIDARLPLSLVDAAKNGETYSDERMKYFESLSGLHKLTYKTIAPHQWDESGMIPQLLKIHRKDYES